MTWVMRICCIWYAFSEQPRLFFWHSRILESHARNHSERYPYRAREAVDSHREDQLNWTPEGPGKHFRQSITLPPNTPSCWKINNSTLPLIHPLSRANPPGLGTWLAVRLPSSFLLLHPNPGIWKDEACQVGYDSSLTHALLVLVRYCWLLGWSWVCSLVLYMGQQ